MIHKLRPAQQVEKFHRERVPAGDIPCQLLKDESRSLPPAITRRIRHFRTRGELVRADRMQRAIADQVADVGEHPRRAGFDEQVVVKLVEIFLENPNLFGDEIKQLPKRFALFRVTDAMDCREQIVELVRIVAHNITSSSIGAGSRVSSSAAPNEFGSPPLGRFASSRALTIAGEPVRCSAVTFTATTPATACSSAIT